MVVAKLRDARTLAQLWRKVTALIRIAACDRHSLFVVKNPLDDTRRTVARVQ
jgi:hypothetical protein